MIKSVYVYQETFNDYTDEVINLCRPCANQAIANGDNLEELGTAGDFDECGKCGCQNVPSWYSPNPPFKAGTLN